LAKEEPFIPRADAEQVRKEIADTGRQAMAKLKAELPRYGRHKNSRGRIVHSKLPERWVRNFKAVADQLRRDYRLEPAAESPPAATEAVPDPDPLAGLRVVNDDEAA
jgi:hypothetical protein